LTLKNPEKYIEIRKKFRDNLNDISYNTENTEGIHKFFQIINEWEKVLHEENDVLDKNLELNTNYQDQLTKLENIQIEIKKILISYNNFTHIIPNRGETSYINKILQVMRNINTWNNQFNEEINQKYKDKLIGFKKINENEKKEKIKEINNDIEKSFQTKDILEKIYNNFSLIFNYEKEYINTNTELKDMTDYYKERVEFVDELYTIKFEKKTTDGLKQVLDITEKWEKLLNKKYNFEKINKTYLTKNKTDFATKKKELKESIDNLINIVNNNFPKLKESFSKNIEIWINRAMKQWEKKTTGNELDDQKHIQQIDQEKLNTKWKEWDEFVDDVQQNVNETTQYLKELKNLFDQ